MQRLLTILGPLPFMALAILAAGCGLGVAIFVSGIRDAIRIRDAVLPVDGHEDRPQCGNQFNSHCGPVAEIVL